MNTILKILLALILLPIAMLLAYKVAFFTVLFLYASQILK